MTEPHESPIATLDRLHESIYIFKGFDLSQHLEHRFVSSAVARAVQRATGCRDSRIRIGMGAADHSGGCGGAVLPVICVKSKQHIHGFSDDWMAFVVFAFFLEHHVQEVGHEGNICIRGYVSLPGAPAMDGSCQSGHLGDETGSLNHPIFRVFYISAFGIEHGKGRYTRCQHRHRMSILGEGVH